MSKGTLALLYIVLVLSIVLNCALLFDFYRPRVHELLASYKQVPEARASDHIRGNRTASVTLIEYADFQCPYCRRLYGELKTLQPELHFQWVYRQYPLSIHPNAEAFSELSECASIQGKFWQVADALNSNPPDTSTPDAIRVWTAHLGIDGLAIDHCLQDGRTRPKIQQSITEGDSILVDGTPTFFVNGKRYVGALSSDELRAAITQLD